jgi:hypothetical protein
MSSIPSLPCMVCNEQGHVPSDCPELHKDLDNGFYTPAGGKPIAGDEDDSATLPRLSGRLIHAKKRRLRLD